MVDAVHSMMLHNTAEVDSTSDSATAGRASNGTVCAQTSSGCAASHCVASDYVTLDGGSSSYTSSEYAMRDSIAAQILRICAEHGWYIAAAESLTAGLLSDAFVRIAGASQVFLGSAVTYDIAAKSHILHVPQQILDTFGAVCEPVARYMALGTAQLYGNELHGVVRKGRVIGLSTTGVAGPGPDGQQPAGAFYYGIALPPDIADQCGIAHAPDTTITFVQYCQAHGSREDVRYAVVAAVLHSVYKLLSGSVADTSGE